MRLPVLFIVFFSLCNSFFVSRTECRKMIDCHEENFSPSSQSDNGVKTKKKIIKMARLISKKRTIIAVQRNAYSITQWKETLCWTGNAKIKWPEVVANKRHEKCRYSFSGAQYKWITFIRHFAINLQLAASKLFADDIFFFFFVLLKYLLVAIVASHKRTTI